MKEARCWVLDELQHLLRGASEETAHLYQLMRDYPLRDAKALRPALCIATCRALGGTLEAVLPSAAVLELYHNAFLIHDDVEDRSLHRRGRPTLHRTHGMPVAMNVGDAMLALTLKPLLNNTSTLGLGPALRILQAIQEMATVTAEGQALELDWIRRNTWDVSPEDYLRMVRKKTSWYSFVTPVTIGAIIAGASEKNRAALVRFADDLGAAFQIQDDVLNLSDSAHVGKEQAGDLWEGKRTLILLHAVAHASGAARARAIAILERPRPEDPSAARVAVEDTRSRIHELSTSGALTAEVAADLLARLPRYEEDGPIADRPKSHDDVAYLLELIGEHESIQYARDVAVELAREAECALEEVDAPRASMHFAFLRQLIGFVIERHR